MSPLGWIVAAGVLAAVLWFLAADEPLMAGILAVLCIFILAAF